MKMKFNPFRRNKAKGTVAVKTPRSSDTYLDKSQVPNLIHDTVDDYLRKASNHINHESYGMADDQIYNALLSCNGTDITDRISEIANGSLQSLLDQAIKMLKLNVFVYDRRKADPRILHPSTKTLLDNIARIELYAYLSNIEVPREVLETKKIYEDLGLKLRDE